MSHTRKVTTVPLSFRGALLFGFLLSVFGQEIPGRPYIETVFAPVVRFDDVILTGRIRPNGAPTVAWFEYGTNSTTFPLKTDEVQLGEGFEAVGITNHITPLTLGVRHFFRVIASNSFGLNINHPLGFFDTTNSRPVLRITRTNIVALPNQLSAPLNIFVDDLETPPDRLRLFTTFALINGNTNLLDLNAITFAGTETNRSLQLRSVLHEHGSVLLRLSIQDEHGGTASTNISFMVEDFSSGPSSQSPSGADIWADLDADGWLDVFAAEGWHRNLNSPAPPVTLAGFYQGKVSAVFDANNDGILDFLASKLYSVRRRGSELELVSTNLPVPPGFVVVTTTPLDYDLDGDTDLVILGRASETSTRAQILFLRNEGNLSFTALPSARASGVSGAWTDYDLDGDPDLYLPPSADTNVYSGLLLNDGRGALTNSSVVVPNITAAGHDWGDFNGDGRPDLYISGAGGEFYIYIQNADQSLSLAKTIPRVGSLARGVSLADMDNDGQLDLCSYNSDSMFQIISAPPGPRFSFLYLNHPEGPGAVGDYENDGKLDFLNLRYFRNNAARSNSAPSAPFALEQIVSGDSVLLKWRSAEDANQSGGLSYNVRLGTTPGGNEILSALSDPNTGRRSVVAGGNSFLSLQRVVRSLRPGTYYWTVQAVDHSFAGGPFAPVQSFTVGSPVPHLQVVSLAGTRLKLKVPPLATLESSTDLRTWSPLQLPISDEQVEIDISTQSFRFVRARE
jgi:hypothetical protein